MSLINAFSNIAITALLVYGAFLLFIFLIQDRLTFPVPPKNLLLYDREKDFATWLNDGNLQGWKISGEKKDSNLVAVYFGGNGEDVVATIPSLKKIPVSTVYTFNYRGYGLSAGMSSEQSIYEDALLIYTAVKRENPNSTLVIIGYSLGSGVAGYLASNTDASLLVLLAPLHSIERIANENFGVLIPSVIIKNKFNLSDYAKNIRAKTLVICAENDTVIDNSHSREIYANLTSLKRLSFIKSVGHSDLFTKSITFSLMADFFAYADQ